MLQMMNDKGRIVLSGVTSGAISQYDRPPEQRYGIKNTFQLAVKSPRNNSKRRLHRLILFHRRIDQV
jgi:NADPH-dependent curcumin reductase CurA